MLIFYAVMNTSSREAVSTHLSFNNEQDYWEENKHENFLSKAVTQIDGAIGFCHSWSTGGTHLLILSLSSTYPAEAKTCRAWDIQHESR